MLNRIVLSLPVLALAMTGAAQTPQAPKSAEPLKFYKLEFVVKEVEGAKVLNSRAYSMTVAANAPEAAAIRAGTRVPVVSTLTGGQYQFLAVGVNIDCRAVREGPRELSLLLTAEISSLPTEQPSPATTGPPIPPMVRQNKWSSSVIVPLKQPTLVFSSDDLASKRQMQLQLTATPIQ